MRFLDASCPILLFTGTMENLVFKGFKKSDTLVFHTDRTKTEKKVSSCPLTHVGQFGGGVHFDQKCPAVHSRKNVSSAPVVLISTKQSATVRRLARLPEMLAKPEESVANFLNGLLSLGFRSSKTPILGKMGKTTRQLGTKYRLRLA